jgi:hypothetical protein
VARCSEGVVRNGASRNAQESHTDGPTTSFSTSSAILGKGSNYIAQRPHATEHGYHQTRHHLVTPERKVRRRAASSA